MRANGSRISTGFPGWESRRSSRMDVWAVGVMLFLWSAGVSGSTLAWAQGSRPTSRALSSVLKEPLPSEELQLADGGTEWIIKGPTFEYRIWKATGALTAVRVQSDGREVIRASRPLEIQLDDERLEFGFASGQAGILTQAVHQIVVRSQGILRDPAQSRPDVECTLLHTFYDDGVVVTTVKLTPENDLPVTRALQVQFQGEGRFSHYLHKRRDEHGESAARGPLPDAGQTVRFSTLTSCLQVFSRQAALALFTDSGATFLSRTPLDTAEVQITRKDPHLAVLRLRQFVVRVAPGDPPYVLKGGEEFTFRTGLSVAPARIAPPRRHDLRMFAWIGDAQFPYPTDEEIEAAARLGYTLFQMHRLGTPGEPRLPAGELERVIRKVHELGMLFLWTENADLMYDSAPGVQELKAQGQFVRWQGFNYGGRYRASMDPFCDLVATCLASPNGLAEYRLATLNRMLDRYAVDGIYLDDNLAYPNCTLWREHGHPRPVYDCLIELHDMNWRRRHLLRGRCPHVVLVSHNTRALVLPILCDFDAVLYGEGYSFGSLPDYWDYFGMANAIPAQPMIWPGGQDPVRCAAAVAYNYDLLTGGGQYCTIDWRLFPRKFPYAAGVTPVEPLYVRTFNLAQAWFGLYESRVHDFADSADLFATSTPLTYATLYHNQIWGDWLIALANTDQERRETAFNLRAPRALDIRPDADYLLFDILQATATSCQGQALPDTFQAVSIPALSLRLFYLRPQPAQGIFHVWGGKRISEQWDPAHHRLVLAVQGPPGVQDTLYLGAVRQGIERVQVNGETQPFFLDPAQGLVHGNVTFRSIPLEVEVVGSSSATHSLPHRPVAPGPLAPIPAR